MRFQCNVGHGFEVNELYSRQDAELEKALWVAVRTFRERATLARQLSSQERESGRADAAERFEDQVQVAEGHAQVILDRLLAVDPAPPVVPVFRGGGPIGRARHR